MQHTNATGGTVSPAGKRSNQTVPRGGTRIAVLPAVTMKMNSIRRFGGLAAIAFVIIASAAASAFAQGGTSAVAALQLGQGTRAAAMGQAYVALADDPVAAYYNPAGLGRLESGQIGVAHEVWYSNVQRELGVAAFRLGSGALAISASYLHLPPLVGYDILDNPIGDVTAATSVMSAAYGLQLPANLALGLTATYFNQRLADVSATGFAFTAGAQWSLHGQLALGAAIRNFGPQVQMQTVSEPLPREIAVGAAWTIPLSGVAVSIESAFPRDGGTRLRVGGEYASTLGLTVRSGYTTSGSALDESADGITFGAGFAVGRGALDYSYTPGSVLGGVHRFGLSWGIGIPAP